MPELFANAYHGQVLSVSMTTDLLLAELFPEVDRHSVYRDIDAWLWANPKRRPKKLRHKFIVRWFMKEKRRAPLYEEARREIHVGETRYLR